MNREKTETALYLKQWHDGDRGGLEALLERHLPWIRDHVHRQMGPLLRAKGETGDYVQEAVVQVLQYGPRFVVSDEGHFRALLLRITENTLKKQHHRYKALRRDAARERPLPSDTVLHLDEARAKVKTPSQVADHHEREAWIRLSMELMEPDDREIIELRQWESLSFADIGNHLGISEGAAQMKHTRSFKRLVKTVRALRSRNLVAALDESRP